MPDDAFTALFGNHRGDGSRRRSSSTTPPAQAGTSATQAPPVSGPPSGWLAHPVIQVTWVDSGTPQTPYRNFVRSRVISVSPMALNWHAANTGGALPSAATWLSRMMFRISCITTMWSFVEARGGEWRATELYRLIETSDKSQASYRIGTVMAGVAGRFDLDIGNLIHRKTKFGPSSSSRADFIGRRRSDGSWHGIEAKGRGPLLSAGGAQMPAPKDLLDAKQQAKSLGAELRQRGLPVGTDDHWAVHALASTIDVFELLVEDPPGDDGDGEPPTPLDPEVGFPGDDPEERLLQNFYQVVGDLELAREFGTPRGTRQPQPLDGYRGFQMPGTAFWFGAHEALFVARNEQRLTSVMDDMSDIPLLNEPAAYADLGLAVVILPMSDA